MRCITPFYILLDLISASLLGAGWQFVLKRGSIAKSLSVFCHQSTADCMHHGGSQGLYPYHFREWIPFLRIPIGRSRLPLAAPVWCFYCKEC